MYKYRFDITKPYNLDAAVLMLLRYELPDDGIDPYQTNWDYHQAVLYVDGWHEFDKGEMLDYTKMFAMDGIDMCNHKHVMGILDQFETHIRKMIKHETSHVPAT